MCGWRLGDLNVEFRLGRCWLRELNVEILIGEGDERGERVGRADHRAGDAGRGACGGVNGQMGEAGGQTADFFALNEKRM